MSINFDQKRIPSSSHISIELPSDLDHSHDTLEGIALLPTNIEKSSHETQDSKLKFKLLQTISFIIKAHILLGERAIWYFDRLMHAFRHTKKMRLFFSFSPIIPNLLKLLVYWSIITKEIQWAYIQFSIVILALYMMSGIYHCLTKRRFFVLYADPSALEANEGFQELVEKNALMDSLLVQAKEIVDRQENVPQDLVLAIHLAMSDSLRLSNELFVASELLVSRGVDGNGLAQEEINSIPIEIYSAAMAESIDEPDMCSLCIQNFKQKEELRRLPCGHRFHVKCGDEWLKQLAACPNCKVKVENNQDAVQEDQQVV